MGDTPDEKFFYSKIAAPLKQEEIKYMQAFGIDDGDGLLDAKEFVVLTIIRIGEREGNRTYIYNIYIYGNRGEL